MLKYRVISGALLLAGVVLAAYYGPPVVAWIILLLISSLAQLEFYRMANKAGIPVFRFFGVLCGMAMISATFFTIGPRPEQLTNGYKWENMVLLVSMIVIFIRQFPQKHNEKPLSTIACTLFGIFYVPFLFNYITRLLFAWTPAGETMSVSATGRLLVFYLVLTVKFADIGAYFSGKAFGRHKFFPRISPKKTWEGFIGGIATSCIVSCVFCIRCEGQLGLVRMDITHALILGLILSVIGTIGDLFESLVKRAAQVKDSGSAIPGMGGLLDVLDSLLFGAPILYAYARLFLEK